MKNTKICVVTGSRAEYGHLLPLLKCLRSESRFKLQIIATCMHLSEEFGSTYEEIEADNFKISEKVEILLSSDSPQGIAKSLGLGLIGLTDAFRRLQPDILILLGDRFEIFAAAQAAYVAHIPIIHLGGGDTTKGVIDEAFRHSITKMSQIHFVTNAAAAQRVRQLGENPRSIFNVGSLAIDHLKASKRLTREQLEKDLNFEFQKNNLLVTFHPVTNSRLPSDEQFHELLLALKKLGTNTGILFTYPNADTYGRQLIRQLESFVKSHPASKAFPSMGQQKYLSALAEVDVVIGNSSSGIYEAPSFSKPSIDIGDRQEGRIRATSVIHCEPKQAAISNALRKAFQFNAAKVVNPYGDGKAAPRIMKILRGIKNPQKLLEKKFHDWIPQ